MPVYLFTFHAYRSWMPDHRRGYVRRGQGILPTSPIAAAAYKSRSKNTPAVFTRDVQRELLEQTREACGCIEARLHAASTEPTHLHLLVSWKHDRSWLSMRKSIKTALTKRLNALGNGIAFSRGASRKRVRDRAHMDYLIAEYLPRHRGWRWDEQKGWIAPAK